MWGSLIVLALMAFLGACSSAPPTIALQSPVTVTPAPTATPAASTDPLAQLAAFTLTDLKAASADAHAQTPPDQTSFQCYDYLIVLIPTIQLPGGGQTVGAVLAFQRLRDLNNGVASANGTLKSLNLACAPLVIDSQATLNRLIAVAGGAAASAGAIVPIPVP